MMDSEDIRDRVRAFIETRLVRDRAGVDIHGESLIESGIIDSLGIMKLVDFLEKDLGSKIADEDLLPENFDTLDAITRLVASKLH